MFFFFLCTFFGIKDKLFHIQQHIKHTFIVYKKKRIEHSYVACAHVSMEKWFSTDTEWMQDNNSIWFFLRVDLWLLVSLMLLLYTITWTNLTFYNSKDNFIIHKNNLPYVKKKYRKKNFLLMQNIFYLHIRPRFKSTDWINVFQLFEHTFIFFLWSN